MKRSEIHRSKIIELHYTVPLSLLIFSDEPQDQTDLNLLLTKFRRRHHYCYYCYR